jgi:iron complex outermembrane receptor protein
MSDRRLPSPARTPARSRLWIAIALLLPALASAQDAATPARDTPDQDSRHTEAHDLDAVVVTASPLRQTAEQLSQPVEVLAGEALDRDKAGTLGDTLSKLPGVQTSNFGAGVGRPIIRGLDGPRVGVLSGGLSSQDVSTISQDHATAVEPFLADQIEVLKGPATLLYGSGAIGGVVNVVDGRIAERPLDQTVTGRAELRYDTVNDGTTAMARVDASGADGALVLHADGVYREQGDYDTPRGTQRNSDVRTRTGALGASWVGKDGFLGFSASRYQDRYGNPGEPGDAALGEPAVYLDMLQTRSEVKAGVNRPFLIFESLRGSVARTNYEHTEFEGSVPGTHFVNDATDGRIELTMRPFGAWTGALGGQFGDRTFEAIGEEAFVPRTNTRSRGFFWIEHGDYGAFQFDLGARIDRVRTSPDGDRVRDFSPDSFSAGAVWKFADAWRLSLNLDRAERAPAEEELYADGPHAATASYEIGNPDMRKERADQAELGLHYHGQRFEAKAAVYRTDFKGFIYLVDTGTTTPDAEALPIRQWSQADARFRGIEAEVTAHLLDDARGKLDLHAFGDRVRGTLDGGENLPRVVPDRFGMDLRWSADAWRASVGATRVMRQDKLAPGETETAGYTFVDAHFAYHWDTPTLGWEVFADGTNLTDQVGRVHTSFLKDTVLLPGRGVAAGIRVFF